MNTPITDANRLEIWTDPYTESPQEDGDFVRFEICRRLELDRAALMEALLACVAWTCRAVDLEVSGSMRIAQKASIERAESALAAARANFPTE
jgi:hypothetical protein